MSYIDNKIFLNPDSYYKPIIRISPFNLHDCNTTYHELTYETLKKYEIFSQLGEILFLTNSGKEAIENVFNYSSLQKKKTIFIMTSSGNTYISKCVTDTIKHKTNWKLTTFDKADIVYFIHEFGQVIQYNYFNNIRKRGKVLIHDFAYSLASLILSGEDFRDEISVYSLPKFFPVNHGGLVNIPFKFHNEKTDVLQDKSLYFNFTNSNYLDITYLEKSAKQRCNNQKYYQDKLRNFGIKKFWKQELLSPGVAMLGSTQDIDWNSFKVFMNNHGVEMSIFYGKSAFFLPTHQNLLEVEKQYITSLVKYYFEKL